MPCYEPPPPYEAVARESAELAAAILCELVGGRVDRGEPLSPRLLTWYAQHLLVDLEMATHQGDTEKMAATQERIRAVGRLLDLALS